MFFILAPYFPHGHAVFVCLSGELVLLDPGTGQPDHRSASRPVCGQYGQNDPGQVTSLHHTKYVAYHTNIRHYTKHHTKYVAYTNIRHYTKHHTKYVAYHTNIRHTKHHTKYVAYHTNIRHYTKHHTKYVPY